MPASSPPPDKFQREIDDIVRLAEKRLDRQSLRGRARRRTRSVQNPLRGLNIRLPRPEMMAGWGLALMLLSWLASLIGLGPIAFLMQAVGVTLLAAGLIASLMGSRGGSVAGGQEKMWRGERISYGNPYSQNDLMRRIRRFFGRR